MSWDIVGDSFTTTEFTNGTKSIRFKMPSASIVKYVRTKLVLFGDPTFTNVTAKIYYDNNGEIGQLYKSSITTWTKAQILTLDNGVNDIYFEFEDIPLDKNNWYHLVLSGAGANFTDVSHIAWKMSYPFPVYTTGWSPSFRILPQFPYDLVIIGEEF